MPEVRIVLKKTVACHPFYGTTDDVIVVPKELADVWLLPEHDACELFADREARLQLAKSGANATSEALAVEPVEGEADPATEGLDKLFEKQAAGKAEAPAEEADAKPFKPSRK